MSEIQITDNQLFEIIGRKEVENYTIQKELDAYRVSLENTKNLAAEVTALRAAKPALETSNKQLAEKNIELDRALTETRKEREAMWVELTRKGMELTDIVESLDEAKKNVAILNQSVEDGNKRFAELNQTYTALASATKKPKK